MSKYIFIFVFSISLQINAYSKENEKYYNDKFCSEIGGQRETRHYYNYPGGKGYILVDCETDSEVWEGGLDKRSSLDSIQQTIFASIITAKQPAIVIFDTDRKVGKYEHRIQEAAHYLKIKYIDKSY